MTGDRTPNQHIRDYISYYLSHRHPPNYGVMIAGPWGSGKTYLIKAILEQLPENLKYAYVSLYGVTSREEIDWALLQAIYPLAANKYVKLSGRAASVVANAFNADLAKIKFEELLKRPADLIYVFDDLERCEMSVTSVMGYINSFVEHLGARVIVIANEDELNDGEKERYRRVREKLIGKTLKVQSVFTEASGHFLDAIDDAETRNLLTRNNVSVQEIFDQFGQQNLRILKQSLWDFERLFKLLTVEQKKKDLATNSLLKFFLAYSFEVKAGQLAAEDMRDRIRQIAIGNFSKANKENPTPISIVANKYPGTRIADTVLSDDVLIDTLINGIFDKEAIQESVGISALFSRAEDEAAWQTIWHMHERTDDEFEKAKIKLENQFSRREIINVGELLHIFGLRLWLSDGGFLSISRAQIAQECRAYIDDLFKSDLLKSYDENAEDEFRHNSYAGLGFYETQSQEFQELFEYLKQRRIERSKADYPRLANDLLKDMKINSQLFYWRVTPTHSTESKYSRVPILRAMDVHRFVQQLMAMHPSDQREIMMALNARYEHGTLSNVLASEQSWLEEVKNEMMQASRNAIFPEATRFRLGEYVKYYIDKNLNRASGE